MNLKEMTIEQLEERKAAIAVELDGEGADLNALEAEVREIKTELEARKAEEAKKAEIRKSVAEGSGETVQTFPKEEKHTMTLNEIRASQEYIDAFANYIKTEDDREVRALLTENVSGAVPVPVIAEEAIKTARERDGIMSRVRKTYIKGNLKVAFELSATGADVHTEGQAAPNEETLTLGIVTMVPANIKKWIRISDEVMAMTSEAFIRYIYEEITYQIVKKEAALAIADITTAGTTSSSTAVGVAEITAAPGVNTIANAAAYLSDEAENPVVIMNRLTEVNFRAAYAAGSFAVDPFDGLQRIYTSALPAYSTASTGSTYCIVGDLNGEQFNYPEGAEVILKWDDMTEAEKDLIKVVGRVYAAHAVTGLGHFTRINK